MFFVCQPSKEVKEKGKGRAVAAVRQVGDRQVALTMGTTSLWFSCHSWALPVWRKRTRHRLHWTPALKRLSNSPHWNTHTHTLQSQVTALNTWIAVKKRNPISPNEAHFLTADASKKLIGWWGTHLAPSLVGGVKHSETLVRGIYLDCNQIFKTHDHFLATKLFKRCAWL